MAKEIKSKQGGGVKIESIISKSAHKKLKKHAKENETSIAQLIRDQVQSLVK